jgi:hypothetical protein
LSALIVYEAPAFLLAGGGFSFAHPWLLTVELTVPRHTDANKSGVGAVMKQDRKVVPVATPEEKLMNGEYDRQLAEFRVQMDNAIAVLLEHAERMRRNTQT